MSVVVSLLLVRLCVVFSSFLCVVVESSLVSCFLWVSWGCGGILLRCLWMMLVYVDLLSFSVVVLSR